jgi:phosphate uptake regulator
MGDLAAQGAQEALRLKTDMKKVDPRLIKGIVDFGNRVRSLIEDSFNALMKGDVKKSNEVIERVAECEQLERSLTADLMRSVKAVNLAVGLRSIIWDVGQMAKYAEAIAEVAINRYIEIPSSYVLWEKVEAHETRPAVRKAEAPLA